MRHRFFWILLLLPVARSSLALEEISYEALLQELSFTRKPSAQKSAEHPFDSVLFSASMGFSASAVELRMPEKLSLRPGLDIILGVDLLSPQWTAEVAYANAGVDRVGQLELFRREFGLTINRRSGGTFEWRWGLGLGHRFMRWTSDNEEAPVTTSTPLAILRAGMFYEFAPMTRWGVEGSFRPSLLTESLDFRAFEVRTAFERRF